MALRHRERHFRVKGAGEQCSRRRPKVVAESGWFPARPSGTENIYKTYAESFQEESHLNIIVSEAQQIVKNALRQS